MTSPPLLFALRRLRALAPLAFLTPLLLAACGDDGGGEAAGDEAMPIVLVEGTSPFALEDVDATFFEGVPYDTWDETVFDIFVPDAQTPTPFVVYVHGGGFTGGSRKGVYGGRSEEILAYLRAGVAFASIDYRLLEPVDPDGVLKPLNDSRRCLQFLRYHADALNLDPERVVLQGGSAGAGTGLWLAFRDDMADPGSSDPIERESTRITAAAVDETQATYDLVKWSTVVFAEYEFPPLLAAARIFGAEQLLLSFYGIDDADLIDTPDIVEYRASVDLLELYDAGDPPVWIENAVFAVEYPADFGVLYHHAFHARALEDVALEVGADAQVYLPMLRDEAEREPRQAFTLRHLDGG